MKTEVLEINKKSAEKIYADGDSNVKKALESLIGKDKLVKEPLFPTTIQACVEACGKKYDEIFNAEVLRLPVFIISVIHLTYIAEAYNGGVIDFADQNTELWFPWVNRVSGRGLSLGGVVYGVSDALVAPRLCFKNRAMAEKAFKQFPEVFEVYFKGIAVQ